jgi:hypothetical protein
MDVQLVTQYVVRQTTVLLAQLSTAAGVRAPLAHVADQVFFDLARELEAQGVRRNVVADMFGLALRSYQLKMQRLADTAGVQRSLWRDIYVRLEKSSRSRRELIAEFGTTEPKSVSAVLNDLVDSGLAYKSGRGNDAVFGLTSESERERLLRASSVASLANLVWLCLATQGSKSHAELGKLFAVEQVLLTEALDRVLSDGRVTRSDDRFIAEGFEIPVGAEEGWEAAVCDHFRAVATAIGTKVSSPSSRADDTVGGATLCFTVHRDHPKRVEVLDLLRRLRADIGSLWKEVADYNREHPPPSDADRVTFYFGQNVTKRALEPAIERESTESP